VSGQTSPGSRFCDSITRDASSGEYLSKVVQESRWLIININPRLSLASNVTLLLTGEGGVCRKLYPALPLAQCRLVDGIWGTGVEHCAFTLMVGYGVVVGNVTFTPHPSAASLPVISTG